MQEEHLFIPDYEDTEITVDKETMPVCPPPTKKARRGYKECPICSFHDSNLKKHVYTHHLPIYLDPQMVCWTCQKYVGSFSCLHRFHPHKNQFTEKNLHNYYLQVNALLHTLSKKITGTEDPKQLLQHVQKNKLYPMPDPQRIPFTVFEIALL